MERFQQLKKLNFPPNLRLMASLGIVILISYWTYFHNYGFPKDFFWDEQYHIPNAQKYLNGIFFMEPHPPLGKLLIALGEKILHPNALANQYVDTDFAGGVALPDGLDFRGYRFFPALAAWWTAPLIFLVFWLISQSCLYALGFSSLYLFDNALIVHNRGAMLDSLLLFFLVSSILAFLLLLRWRDRPVRFAVCAVLYGICFALATTTKVTGLILLLLIPAVLFQTWRDWRLSVKFLGCSLISFAIAFCTIWQLHFAIAATVNPKLANEGYFEVSEEFRQVLKAKATGDLVFFPLMLKDALAYIPSYNSRVPSLDLCNIKDGGTPAFLWPLGARTINYRWESPDGFIYKYLYLQSNPISWAIALLGILLSTCFTIAAAFLPTKEKVQNVFLMAVFLSMYLGYMIVMLSIKRTMYLYHYFPPLVFSYFLAALAFSEIKQAIGQVLTPKSKNGILAVLVIGIFLSFQFFKPFTYYEPLTDVAFKKRILIPVWNLRCINCEQSTWVWTPREPPSS